MTPAPWTFTSAGCAARSNPIPLRRAASRRSGVSATSFTSNSRELEERAGHTLGVIDIGSNSGRVLVARVDSAAHLDVLGDARSPLRLVRDVVRAGELSGETIERTLHILRGFLAVAIGAGAERTTAVATAAVREATNGEELIQRTRGDLGIPVDIADGEEEARFGFLGAIHGVPITHGIVLDVGGGSLQLVHFRQRRMERFWSLPLGALRLSDRFLKSDPPSRGDMRALKEHVYDTLEQAGVRPLLADERLIGTGGTNRNLGKVDRRLRGDYPISRLHGYVVYRRRLDDVTALLAGTSATNRAGVPGLNSDRSDSIVGGALVVQAVMDRLLAAELTVAGYGLREGIALHSVTDQAAGIDEVQRASVAALGAQFGAFDSWRAERRAIVTDRLLKALAPGFSAEGVLATAAAAQLLEIGASIDHYRRFAHTARIVADANLDGYSHRTLALIAAAVYAVGEREASIKGYAPLLTVADQPVVEQIAAAVGLADALVRYGGADPETPSFERSNRHVVLDTSIVDTWPVEPLVLRAERAFRIDIRVGAAAQAG